MWLIFFSAAAARVGRFSALTLGFFGVASRRYSASRAVRRFSALTLGFFDVARPRERLDDP